jgi:type III secretion protein D
MSAALAADPTLDYELRVLEGEQRGARAHLPLDRSFVIGGPQSDSDVQLRDPLIGGTQVRVTLHGAAGAQALLLAGEAWVNGEALAAGTESPWPLYVPLRLGATTLAIGEPGSAQWALPALARPEPRPPAASPAPAPRVTAPRRTERWLALAGALLVLAALALGVWSAWPQPKPPVAGDLQQRALRVLMTDTAFQALRVEAGPAGPVVRGYLDTAARREALQQRLANAGLGAVQLEVWSGEQLATAVADVFRVQGITARTEGDTAGRVTAYTQEADAERLERAAATARRDVAGLVSLELQNRRPPPPPENVPVVDDPGKRIASIVPGESAYVVTADGTRYFTGALLPTGHRIEAITARSVELVKDGQRHELHF